MYCRWHGGQWSKTWRKHGKYKCTVEYKDSNVYIIIKHRGQLTHIYLPFSGLNFQDQGHPDDDDDDDDDDNDDDEKKLHVCVVSQGLRGTSRMIKSFKTECGPEN
jgi:hypothetical protein